MRRDYRAVVMQLGGIIVLTIGSFPYFHQVGNNVERDFVAIMMGFIVLMAAISFVIGWWCGLSILPAPVATHPSMEGYITFMAAIDITLIAVLVAASGGLTDSSYVSLLMLVPALAMLNRAKRMGILLLWFIVLFCLLVVLKLPNVDVMVASSLGDLARFVSYKCTANRGAYEASTILILFFSVVATYAQYVTSRRPQQENGRY